jgi:hypothetical protein
VTGQWVLAFREILTIPNIWEDSLNAGPRYRHAKLVLCSFNVSLIQA